MQCRPKVLGDVGGCRRRTTSPQELKLLVEGQARVGHVASGRTPDPWTRCGQGHSSAPLVGVASKQQGSRGGRGQEA